MNQLLNFLDFASKQKKSTRGGVEIYDVKYYKYLTLSELYEWWCVRQNWEYCKIIETRIKECGGLFFNSFQTELSNEAET